MSDERLIDPRTFCELISGERRGAAASAARGALGIVEVPYTWGVRWRNRRFDRGCGVTRVEVPVVSVGNITLGGVGKTPLVAWICRRLRERGLRVAILSRGYGAQQGAANDEALELEWQLPDVPHLQDPDRVRSAGVAIEELTSQLLVLDDGFQHRRLARDLDVVVLDALAPFGCDRVFPRGMLREPLAGLARAGAIVLSRADLVDEAERMAIRRRVEKYSPHALWCEASHRAMGLVNAAGETAPLSALLEIPAAAFCGLGNPAGFWRTLESLGCQALASREFPDHHAYTKADVASLASWAQASGARQVLCTRKDLVKLQTNRLGDVPLWAVAVELAFLEGESDFASALARLADAAE
jgi:tetraacyldisaccharide 4'-kinase